MIDFDASEFHQLTQDLSGADGRIGPLVKRIVAKTTLDVERDAKAFAPVDTGNLKNSIGHNDLRSIGSEGTIEGEVGPTANYGPFVELGTSRMAPRAFLGPALDRNSPAFTEAMASIVEEATFG